SAPCSGNDQSKCCPSHLCECIWGGPAGVPFHVQHVGVTYSFNDSLTGWTDRSFSSTTSKDVRSAAKIPVRTPSPRSAINGEATPQFHAALGRGRQGDCREKVSPN